MWEWWESHSFVVTKLLFETANAKQSFSFVEIMKWFSQLNRKKNRNKTTKLYSSRLGILNMSFPTISEKKPAELNPWSLPWNLKIHHWNLKIHHWNLTISFWEAGSIQLDILGYLSEGFLTLALWQSVEFMTSLCAQTPTFVHVKKSTCNPLFTQVFPVAILKKHVIWPIYGCFEKEWYPQIIHFNRIFHYKPFILG